MRTATTRRAATARALYATIGLLITAEVATAQNRDAARVSPAPAAGPAAGEDDRYFARANALRYRILEQASWADFGHGECRAGALRVFSTDSASAVTSKVTELIAELERIVIVRGVETPLDSEPVKQLLTTLIGWEAGITRPNWDVPARQETREALAAGLTGEFLNPITGACELLSPMDTMRFLLPDGLSAEPPASREQTVLVRSGSEGLNSFRDEFFAASGHEANSALVYTNVIALVPWRGYAVVAVNRPAELRGAVLQKKTTGGAVYLFHRVNNEWRLLTITRTWG
ncbi:MAG TPA: hypothetical protein VMM77_08625 [Gemmatimonadaceae bacterium]|nr:hypothetical protein [Gemmatimonadaceae bacterium]